MPYVTLENGKKIKISEESYEELLAKAIKEENEILVPDNIKIGKCYGGDDLGIVFSDKKKILFFHECIQGWVVAPTKGYYFVKCKLIPVKEREELEKGYTYFRTDGEVGTEYFLKTLRDMSNYCKFLGNGKCAYINFGTSVEVNIGSWKYWYRVVPIVPQSLDGNDKNEISRD